MNFLLIFTMLTMKLVRNWTVNVEYNAMLMMKCLNELFNVNFE